MLVVIDKNLKRESEIAMRTQLAILGHGDCGVTEVRVFNPLPLVAYGDSDDNVVRLIMEMQDKTDGIFIGIQPRQASLHDRAPNRWVRACSKPESNCASSQDIEYVANGFWDIDVVSDERNAGYAASDRELEKTLSVAQAISGQDGLVLSSVICRSGNGHYVLTPIVPIAVDSDDIAIKFRRFCQWIAEPYQSVKGIRVDQVFDLPRVMRAIGTKNGKGIATSDRPHRMAHFASKPTLGRSMALHHMILNMDIDQIGKSTQALPKVIRCDLRKLEQCDLIRLARNNPSSISEPLWFALITNLVYLQGGRELIHSISKLDMARYSYIKTEQVINRVLERNYRPILCQNFSALQPTCLAKEKFHCPRIKTCPARSPIYLASLHTVFKR